MSRFINPFTDVGFKIIFGQEFSKPQLLDFLNALLVGERSVTDLKFLDKEQPAIYDGDRSPIYDILCETDSGEKIIVEMQNREHPNFKERMLYQFERWIYILKNMDTLTRMPWAAQNAVFQRLAEVAEVSKLSKEERLEYDHALKRYRDTLNAMTGAEQKGRAEGEHVKAVESARRMKADKMPVELISKYTGLPQEEIEQL